MRSGEAAVAAVVAVAVPVLVLAIPRRADKCMIVVRQ